MKRLDESSLLTGLSSDLFLALCVTAGHRYCLLNDEPYADNQTSSGKGNRQKGNRLTRMTISHIYIDLLGSYNTS